MKLQVMSPPVAGSGFRLGRDLIGHGRLGAGGEVWNDLLPIANSVTAVRGGTTPALNALDVGTLTVPLRGVDPSTDPRLTTGRRVRLIDDDRADTVLWSGRIGDCPATDDRDTIRATLTASDVVAMLSGAIDGIGVYNTPDTLDARIGRLSAAAAIPIDYDPGATIEYTADLVRDPGYTWTATPVAGVVTTPSADRRVMTLTPAAEVAGYAYGTRTTLTGLRIGQRYKVTASVSRRYPARPTAVTGIALGIVGIGYASTFPPGTMPTAQPLAYEFVATATSHVVEAVGSNETPSGDTVTITVIDPQLIAYHYEPPLQANVHQGTAREHLDMSCDSILGAVWRPTADYRLEVLRRPDTAIVATLSDRPVAEYVAHEAGYTAIDAGYAPGDSVINDVEVTNIGRDEAGEAVDVTSLYADNLSANTYGRKSVQVTTTLATPADVTDLGNATATDRSTPGWTPTRVAYRYADLDVIPDLYDVVEVIRKGNSWLCRVVGIAYEIRADTRTYTTLTLRQI